MVGTGSCNSPLPSWNEYNQSLQNKLPQKSILHYLPVVEANANDHATVMHVLQSSIDIPDLLELDAMVVVLDQALYSKAPQIK